MKLATINDSPVDSGDKRAHTCNVCGSVKFWTDDHRHVERPVGKGAHGYEIYFITCSDECRKEARDIFIEWLASKDGWDKKKATENYDLYIAKKPADDKC